MPADRTDHVAVLRRLAVRQRLGIGALDAQGIEFRTVLAAAALAVAPERDHDEAAVNAALRDWLAGAGAMLATDHVELRRWLVDCGLLARDGYGRRYWRPPPAADWAPALAALGAVDAAGVVHAARADDAARRAERKARYATAGNPRRNADG
jgi:hypothetical protein